MLQTYSNMFPNLITEEYMRYVVGIILSEDHKYVLLLKKNKPVEIAGLWNGLGGKIEKFESPEYAVSREVKEEAGFEVELDAIHSLGKMVVCSHLS